MLLAKVGPWSCRAMSQLDTGSSLASLPQADPTESRHRASLIPEPCEHYGWPEERDRPCRKTQRGPLSPVLLVESAIRSVQCLHCQLALQLADFGSTGRRPDAWQKTTWQRKISTSLTCAGSGSTLRRMECPACTFVNALQSARCTMCDAALVASNKGPKPAPVANFPLRALIQNHNSGGLSDDCTAAKLELAERGVPVLLLTVAQLAGAHLSRSDLVVGDFDFVRESARLLGIPMPEPCDYPKSLQHLLYRRVWRSTLGEVQALLRQPDSQPFFIKPASDHKAFSGLVASADWLTFLVEEHGRDLEVWCSELVEFVSEYRVYCIDGAAVCVSKYGPSNNTPLDMAIVEDALRLFLASEDGAQLSGCGVDFGVMRKGSGELLVTALIEVNEGFALGRYDSLTPRDYTSLLISRWRQFVSQ